ncbi:MAG TPA: PH domain-containing protein [Longimicrobiaceae bacterium]
MPEGLRRWLLKVLRVPPEPAIPEGASVRVFRAAPAYFRYRLVLWALGQLGALGGLIAGLIGLSFLMPIVTHPLLSFGLRAVEAVAWLTFVVQLLFSLAVLRLDFDLRWYVLSDRSLRIREGIMTVKEKTMTFANIQQISIRQNPIQRLLGIADVHVRTAGGGAGGSSAGEKSGESTHEAYFRGVNNADEIKGAIQDRVRLHRDAGLGDPDEPAALPPAPTLEPVLAAAREVLAEVRRWPRVTG